MSAIPKSVADRLMEQTRRFRKILKSACDRGVSEAETIIIVADFLSDVFGFNRYSEVTGEYAFRGMHCNLAAKIKNDVKYLLEVKVMGSDLKENHLPQIVNYAENKGISWVVLTNGVTWEIFLLCKEGLNKAVVHEYHQRMKSLNRYLIGAIVLSPSSLDLIRRKLRRLAPDVRVEPSEIEAILKKEVLKREVIEGESAQDAQRRVEKTHIESSKEKISRCP